MDAVSALLQPDDIVHGLRTPRSVIYPCVRGVYFSFCTLPPGGGGVQKYALLAGCGQKFNDLLRKITYVRGKRGKNWGKKRKFSLYFGGKLPILEIGGGPGGAKYLIFCKYSALPVLL